MKHGAFLVSLFHIQTLVQCALWHKYMQEVFSVERLIVNHLHKNLATDRVDREIFGGASKEFQQSSSAVSNPPLGLQLLLLELETNFQKLSSEMIFNFLRQIGGIYLVQTLTASCVDGAAEAEEGGPL